MIIGNRKMQRGLSNLILRIHIRTSSQVLFNGFDVSSFSSSVNRFISIQPSTRLAAVFAEKVGKFGRGIWVIWMSSKI